MSSEQTDWQPEDETSCAVKEQVCRRRKPKRIPRYHVVLWNDEEHTYEYVILMLKELFGHPAETGYRMAKTVDKYGKATVLTTTLEHAEFKRDQIHAYGADPLLRGSAGSMSATIEKTEDD